MPQRPTPRPRRTPSRSMRPTPNPRRSDPVSRGNKSNESEQSRQNDVLMNGGRGKAQRKAYGGKMKTKKMAMGGKCRGMGAASRGGKYKSS